MIIAIDFDGTVVTHNYPEIGSDVGAVPVLKKLVDNGHQLILWTMRSGKELEEAEFWFASNNIPLLAVQVNPTQHEWTTSPKAYAEIYIDDAALGCPLVVNLRKSPRAYVDWKKISDFFHLYGAIQHA